MDLDLDEESKRKAAPRPATPGGKKSSAIGTLGNLLGRAGIRINGDAPWDIHINDDRAASRILAQGSLGLGESYMDGWWDCAALDIFFERIFQANLTEHVTAKDVLQTLKARLLNLQSSRRSWQVGKAHYDVGNDLFSEMLDSRMTYSCGYWNVANNLEDAQAAKLDLVCRKLGLQPGMRLLDIGCGWGSLMQFAAENYGVSCVGLTISKEQAEFARQKLSGLPVEFRLADYRSFNPNGDEKFDRIASIGMFEHVGHKNYGAFFDACKRSLVDDGLFLLHTIGRKRTRNVIDPWFDRYIFPNGELPSLSEISTSVDGRFVIEDVHNFGADYDKTLLAWHARFEAAWPQFASQYGERFYRMWRYYLLCMAGCFRARQIQLWQTVLSPSGVAGGYLRHS
ncbi:cyclopropane fatty acyl phospholipid synthase [Phyllobacterium myrsinacearum]|uniref:Cyclopropane-fatty-acyl-phospholipid synthase n=1 Tax=Phyllobacterium myrsinacearum TaxID=28101 RepID=A0A839EJ80_9HYPH|nr:cyclopropane fatty acyl phospholipid synthase [Phyllobacterium myrsinacearum]MBA8878859.1 cyclopropane-fatty-acyl-phospholipid synthase [Phyllobacterium myrsinacearum]